MWLEIRHPKSGKLQFRYDPVRQLAEIQDRGDKQVIDLKQYQEQEPQANASVLQKTQIPQN